MEELSTEKLRILDANIDRIGEGLRVLEEFARMMLNDTVLTQRLKNLRHKLVNTGAGFQKQLIQARDAQGDVGSSMDVPGEEKSRDNADIITANARRVQESLRVMEEITKAPGVPLDTEAYRKARFELYAIEKELLSKLLRRDKTQKIKGLYGVVDTEWLKGRKHTDVTEQMLRGGAGIIQLRCKEGSTREFLGIAKDIKHICAKNDVLFIVNDRLEVALASQADGLHVGQDDLPAAAARKLIPIDMILGVSVRTVGEAKAAFKDGADYLGVGAMYSTATKEDAVAVGPGRIKEVRKAVDLPVVAIGGINKDNLREVIKAGADSAAVISAILGADNVEKAARQLADIFGEESHG
jgi:thiamine-phosphate pyrophosphorylase